MPIRKRRFERLDDDAVRPGTNAERILAFLLQNEEFAYRMTEIAEETDIKRGSVGPTLKRLEDDGLVDHEGQYWRISESYLSWRDGLGHTFATASEYDDGAEFDSAAWADKAEDERATAYTEEDGEETG